MTGQADRPVIVFLVAYVAVAGVVAPFVGAVIAERRATIRRRSAARQVRTLDGKRLERRVLAARAAGGAR